MNKLTKRQQSILQYIQKNKKASNREIKEHIQNSYEYVSRYTIIRDIDILLKNKLIKKLGKGRSVFYEEAIKNSLLEYIDIEEYFNQPPDTRKVNKKFNFEIFEQLLGLFSPEEEKKLLTLNEKYRKSVKSLSSTLLNKEFERMTIELSWKSSHIEGNTYNLLETEHLIKEHKAAKGHSKEEAVMILNHKEAIDYIYKNKTKFKKLSISKTEDVHYLLTKNMGIERSIRKRLVGVTGTSYQPPDNKFQIEEALNQTCKLINNQKNVLAKALIINSLIAYIQPFEDGNKRTSRIMGNAVLMAHDFCPLSFRSIDELEYKKAILLFYEQNNIRYFKELFIDQFRFAVNNYF